MCLSLQSRSGKRTAPCFAATSEGQHETPSVPTIRSSFGRLTHCRSGALRCVGLQDSTANTASIRFIFSRQINKEESINGSKGITGCMTTFRSYDLPLLHPSYLPLALRGTITNRSPHILSKAPPAITFRAANTSAMPPVTAITQDIHALYIFRIITALPQAVPTVVPLTKEA